MKTAFISLIICGLLCHPLLGVPLKRGTTVIVRLTTPANSNNQNAVSAEIAYDIEVDGQLIIARGTPVTLAVDKIKAKGVGKGGYVQIGCIATSAINGQPILLNGGVSKEGDDRQGEALGLGIGLGLTFLPILGFGFLFLKGEKIHLPAGTTILGVTVANNYELQSE